MVFRFARMILSRFIFCAIILKICTAEVSPYQSNFYRQQFARNFDFSSEDVTTNPASDQTNNLRTSNKVSVNGQENYQEPLSNILKEVGTSQPQKVYKKVYNESAGTRICWKTLTYVRDSNLVKGERFPWREYEVVFDSPISEDNSRKIEDIKDEVRSYKVKDPETGSVELVNFTVIERNVNFTLSKHEKVHCGSGTFLTKIYYEGDNKKRVVVKLSDQPSDLDEEEEPEEPIGSNIQDESENKELPFLYQKNSEGGQRRSIFDDQNNKFSKNDSKTTKFHMESDDTNADNINEEDSVIKKTPLSADFHSRPLTNLEVSNLLAQHRKLLNNINNGTTSFYPNNPVEDEDDFMDLTVGASENDNNGNELTNNLVAPEERVYPDAVANSKGSTSTVDPCGPILASLLSENGLLPGLCSLGKNEKVVLKGDITVSKKYFDKENTEIIEPMYVIRENTEIKAIQGIRTNSNKINSLQP